MPPCAVRHANARTDAGASQEHGDAFTVHRDEDPRMGPARASIGVTTNQHRYPRFGMRSKERHARQAAQSIQLHHHPDTCSSWTDGVGPAFQPRGAPNQGDGPPHHAWHRGEQRPRVNANPPPGVPMPAQSMQVISPPQGIHSQRGGAHARAKRRGRWMPPRQRGHQVHEETEA